MACMVCIGLHGCGVTWLYLGGAQLLLTQQIMEPTKLLVYWAFILCFKCPDHKIRQSMTVSMMERPEAQLWRGVYAVSALQLHYLLAPPLCLGDQGPSQMGRSKTDCSVQWQSQCLEESQSFSMKLWVRKGRPVKEHWWVGGHLTCVRIWMWWIQYIWDGKVAEGKPGCKHEMWCGSLPTLGWVVWSCHISEEKTLSGLSFPWIGKLPLAAVTRSPGEL
jgi:hypothetical protein